LEVAAGKIRQAVEMAGVAIPRLPQLAILLPILFACLDER
jgi:hypothetical protein